MRRVVAVASGKGGVGKTWFSISLGQALAQSNRRVLLVDCDVGLANVDVQLGLNPRVDLQQAYMGEVDFSHAISSVDPLGFDVLPGRARISCVNGLDASMVGWLLGELRQIVSRYDIVILDLPSGVEFGVREFMRHADHEIIVTTSEPTALTDAYALIKATQRYRRNSVPKMICNFADDGVAGRRTLEGLSRVCNRFLGVEPQQLGVIRRDPRVPDAISQQVPLLQCYPGSDAARDVAATAKIFLAMEGVT